MSAERDMSKRRVGIAQIRQVAIASINTSAQLADGFIFEIERVPLINPQRSTFKPGFSNWDFGGSDDLSHRGILP